MHGPGAGVGGWGGLLEHLPSELNTLLGMNLCNCMAGFKCGNRIRMPLPCSVSPRCQRPVPEDACAGKPVKLLLGNFGSSKFSLRTRCHHPLHGAGCKETPMVTQREWSAMQVQARAAEAARARALLSKATRGRGPGMRGGRMGGRGPGRALPPLPQAIPRTFINRERPVRRQVLNLDRVLDVIMQILLWSPPAPPESHPTDLHQSRKACAQACSGSSSTLSFFWVR